jgi:hypothetical protein
MELSLSEKEILSKCEKVARSSGRWTRMFYIASGVLVSMAIIGQVSLVWCADAQTRMDGARGTLILGGLGAYFWYSGVREWQEKTFSEFVLKLSQKSSGN